MNRAILLFVVAITAAGQTIQLTIPRIWDDRALNDWATPIAALGVRPGHFTSAEYYAVAGDNLKTYPVYRPDREPPGYWEWLQKQKPEPLVDASKLRSRSDWVKAGEVAFRELDSIWARTSDPERIRAARDLKSYDTVWTQPDGSLLPIRWVITDKGVQLTITACSSCHARAREDDSILWGAPTGNRPTGIRNFLSVSFVPVSPGDTEPIATWRQFTVPWAPDARVEKIRDMSDDQARDLVRGFRGTMNRTHGNPWYTTKAPDLNGVQYNRYLDATGTHRLRSAADIARYAALVTRTDPMEFGEYKILKPEQRRIRFRYSDEVLYSIGLYLFSLEPPRNSNVASTQQINRGREVFTHERCVNCHPPPNYTSAKLTLAEGFTPPADHPNKSDILHFSVDTDPGLAMKTRKGTGFYKIPSLRGLWYRPALLHDGSVASLEEMFDPDRLNPDHVPGGWKGPGVTKRAIPGHRFGLSLNAEDKAALFAFLRSL